MNNALPIGMLLVFVILAAALGGTEPFYDPPSAHALGQKDDPASPREGVRTLRPLGRTMYGIPYDAMSRTAAA
jgi:hypothetical protein